MTGFEPFGNQHLNPSLLLLNQLQKDPRMKSICEFLVLPVDYDLASQILRAKLQSQSWKGWVGFGQAGGRSRISLERVALNWKEKDFNQSESQMFEPAPLDASAASAFINPMNLGKILAKLRLASIPSEISFSAGTYVCNSVYFCASQTLKPEQSFCLFVHVPFLPEQSETQPTMNFELMQKAAEIIIHRLDEEF